MGAAGSQRTRVLLVDDHTILRAAVRALLETTADIEVAGEAASAEDAVDAVGALAPDIVLMDLRMPGLGGVEGIVAIKEMAPGTRVLVLSAADDPGLVRRALGAGADGYLTKTAGDADLRSAIRAVRDGARYVHPPLGEHVRRQPPREPIDGLSLHELEVVRLSALGHTHAEIGGRLGVSARSAEHVRTAALDKLGVRTRAELVRVLMAAGLFRLSA
jgi:DNA-binding NarL/FixJ family response regulator